MSNVSNEIRDRASDYLGALKGISAVEPFVTDSMPDGGMLVTTKLKNNGDDSWGWYFEKGDIKRAFFAPEELAQFISASAMQRSFASRLLDAPPLDLIKTVVVATLTFVFSGAAIYIVISMPENKSLQVITGLLGLTIGYLVGKGDQRS